tara:strand:+ start:46 stop:159 length:114 start_codon:yes stop_codon:yes gene_type:complete
VTGFVPKDALNFLNILSVLEVNPDAFSEKQLQNYLYD